MLPRLPVEANVIASSAVTLALMAVIVWGLVPLASLGRRLAVGAVPVLLLAVLLVHLGLVPAANLAKIAGAAMLGIWIAGEIERASWVAIVALVAAAVDVVSVVMGPTKEILEQGPMIVGYVTLTMTWFGYAYSEAYSALGVSDVIFFALYLAAARRFGLRPHLSAVVMVASFLATLATALWWRPLPALPLLSLAFVLANADLLLAARRGERERDRVARPAGEQGSS